MSHLLRDYSSAWQSVNFACEPQQAAAHGRGTLSPVPGLLIPSLPPDSAPASAQEIPSQLFMWGSKWPSALLGCPQWQEQRAEVQGCLGWCNPTPNRWGWCCWVCWVKKEPVCRRAALHGHHPAAFWVDGSCFLRFPPYSFLLARIRMGKGGWLCHLGCPW